MVAKHVQKGLYMMQELSWFLNYISSCLNVGYDLSFRCCLTALDPRGYKMELFLRWFCACCVDNTLSAKPVSYCSSRHRLNSFILLFLPLKLIFLWT